MHRLALTLLMVLIPAGWFYLPGRETTVGRVVCHNDPPFVYCAANGQGRFDFVLDRERFGALSLAVPESQTLRYPYVIQPLIQWISPAIGKEVCWTVRVLRRLDPGDSPGKQDHWLPASRPVRTCGRVRRGLHLQLTWLDAMRIEGDGRLAMSISHDPARRPVELVGTQVAVTAVYPDRAFGGACTHCALPAPP